MNRTTGLRKRSEETRRRFAAERSYSGALLSVATVFQPLFITHNQKLKPSCVGQAWTGRIEAHLKRRLSGDDLWTDARRRQGDLNNPDVGTDSEHAIASLVNRGVSDYVPGEDDRPTSEDVKPPTLSQEEDADDHRLDAAAAKNHQVIDAPRRAALSDALQRGKAVCTGGGVTNNYSSLQTNQVADETMLDPNADGHEEGVLAYIAPEDSRFPKEWRDCAIYQNSWDEDWGGVILPCDITCTDGTFYAAGTLLAGCALVPMSLVDKQWDMDTLDVVIS